MFASLDSMELNHDGLYFIHPFNTDSRKSVKDIYTEIVENGAQSDLERCFAIYSEEILKTNVQTYLTAFREFEKEHQIEQTFDLSYSIKANYNPNILKSISKTGASFATTVSGNEIKLVEKCGYRNIIFNGTGKRLSEIETAVKMSNGMNVYINIDSEFDYNRIKQVDRRIENNAKFLLRYNPDVEEMEGVQKVSEIF